MKPSYIFTAVTNTGYEITIPFEYPGADPQALPRHVFMQLLQIADEYTKKDEVIDVSRCTISIIKTIEKGSNA